MYRWKAQSQLEKTITVLSQIRINMDGLQSPTVRRFGAGDLVASVTKALGVSPCASCARRAERLNGAFSISRVQNE